MSGIKSRPLYAPLRIDPTGRTHLIVSDLQELPENAIETGAAEVELWLNGNPVTQAAATGSLRKFRAVADLKTNLCHRLKRAAVGLRLYAVGTEAFLWDVNNIATAAGRGPRAIFFKQAGSQRRGGYCTPCPTMNQDVTTSIVICSGCGTNLLVRDHFSRRLAAFMGIAVDAEVPGQVPAPEVLYP